MPTVSYSVLQNRSDPDNTETVSLSSEEDYHDLGDVELSLKTWKDSSRASCVNRLLLLIGAALILVAVTLISLFVSSNSSSTSRQQTRRLSPPVIVSERLNQSIWLFDNHVMEGSIQLMDVNGDGVPDVIIPLILQDQRLEKLWKASKVAGRTLTPEQVCKGLGLSAPCLGRLVAVDGVSGKVLWTVGAHQSLFELSCHTLDVDRDGVKDCLSSGRRATLIAVDALGHVMWRLSRSRVKSAMNIYRPLVVDDVDGDGIRDLFIVLGGNSDYLPEEHDRESGRVCIISGKSGKLLAPCLIVPDKRESYMSPVRLHRPDGKKFILFGTGGETVYGSLYAFEESRIQQWYRHRDNVDVEHQISKWTRKVSGSRLHKGFSVPPMVMKKGEIDEWFVVIGFDGVITALNSSNFEPLWVNMQFLGWETYSSSVRGFFNDDAIEDIGIQLSRGAWPHYDRGVAIILDGKTGAVLWKMMTDASDMSSPLLVRAKPPNKDIFVFRVRGQEATTNEGRRVARHGEPVTDDSYQKKLASMQCKEDPKTTVRLLLVNGGSSPDVKTIAQFKHREYHYHINISFPYHSDPLSFSNEDVAKHGLVGFLGSACSILRPMELQTGAIFINGDRKFTMYVPTLYQGYYLGPHLGIEGQKSQVTVTNIIHETDIRLKSQLEQDQLQYLMNA